jgi:Sec-independent protein translocase protein TatA
MFNIGFSEILLIIIVAIIVLKPKDIPVIMEKAGLQFNMLKRFVQAVLRGLNE